MPGFIKPSTRTWDVHKVAPVARPRSPSLDVARELVKFRDVIAAALVDSLAPGENVTTASHVIEDLVTVLFLTGAGLASGGHIAMADRDVPDSTLPRGSCTPRHVHAIMQSLQERLVRSNDVKGKASSSAPGGLRLFRDALSNPVVSHALESSPAWLDLLEFCSGVRWIPNETRPHDARAGLVATPAVFGHLHELQVSKLDPVQGKHTGTFYTPSSISSYICNRCIMQFILSRTGLKPVSLEHVINHLERDVLARLLGDIARIKILDPSCGAGEFLVMMAKTLYSLQKKMMEGLPGKYFQDARSMKFAIISRNLFGADLSADAIFIAKKRLFLWMLDDDDAETCRGNHEVPDLEGHVILGNALVGWLDEPVDVIVHGGDQSTRNGLVTGTEVTARLSRLLAESVHGGKSSKIDIEPYHPIHWRIAFHDVFEEKNGFDIIVGNPPYVFIRGHHFDETERAYFASWYFNGYSTITSGKARQSGKWNAFSLFIARSIRLLNEGGILGFIVPNTLLRTTTNDITRQFIVNSTIIHEIVDLQDGVFDGVVAATIILLLEKNSGPSRHGRVIIKHAVEDLASGKYRSHEVDQDRFPRNNACIFDIHVDDAFKKLFDAMRSNSTPLGDACSEIIEGLVTRRGDNLLVNRPDRPGVKKLLRGKDIDRYTIRWPTDRYIVYDPGALHRARPVAVHEAPVKLLAQRIGGGAFPLRVAYDDQQHYFFASINAIILKNKGGTVDMLQEYKYILAILNSTTMNAYYLLNFSNKSPVTVNVGKTFLGALPIKRASQARRECIARIVDYIRFLNEHRGDEDGLVDYFDKTLVDGIIFDLYASTDENDGIFVSMRRILRDIDIPGQDVRGVAAILSEVKARLEADPRFATWLAGVHARPDYQAIKDLFEQGANGLVN